MFLVKPDTVELLFNAQKEEMRGRLRLDVSSRCFPADPAKPLDLRCAGEAVGERFVRLLKSCAVGAAMFGNKYDVFPPAPDSFGRLRIMPSPDTFEPFVLTRLQAAFGLNQESPEYRRAIRSLASDFTEWARAEPEARDPFGVELDEPVDGRGSAFIRCEAPPQEDFTPLDRGGPSRQEVQEAKEGPSEPSPTRKTLGAKPSPKKKKNQ